MTENNKKSLLKFISIIVFIFLTSIITCASDKCNIAADEAEKGQKIFSRNNKKGIKYLHKAYSHCSQPVYAYNLGHAYYLSGNKAQALKYFEQAVNKDDTNPKWLNNYAYVLLESGNQIKALEYAKKAIQLDSNYEAAIDTYERAVLSVNEDEKIPAAKQKNKYGIAFILVNQDYSRMDKGLPDVDFAKRDGLVMKKYIEKTFGYESDNIIYMENLTSADFRDVFGNNSGSKGLIHNYVRDGESDLFIYYSGHGSPGEKSNLSYLVPVDARIDLIENNGYPLDQFYKALETVKAKSKTIVIDACFSGNSVSGPLFRNISPALLDTTELIREVFNTNLFCATGKGQVSTWYPEKRHSLFTYYFLKGLQGEADKDFNRIITAGEMEHYLKLEVKYMANRLSNRLQTPVVTGDKNRILIRLR